MANVALTATIRGMDMNAPRVMAGCASDETFRGICAGQRQKLFVAAAILAVLAASALIIDLPVAQFVKSHPLRGELARVVRLAEVFGWGGTVTILILTAVVLDRRGGRMLLPLGISSLGAGLLADGIKLAIGRLRPSAAESLSSVRETFIGWLPLASDISSHGSKYAVQSFPSAHSATAAGLAAALAAIYPRGRWLFAVFAALAMLQRIEAHAHWCSDVLAGAALGCCVAAAVAWNREVRGRRSEVGSH